MRLASCLLLLLVLALVTVSCQTGNQGASETQPPREPGPEPAGGSAKATAPTKAPAEDPATAPAKAPAKSPAKVPAEPKPRPVLLTAGMAERVTRPLESTGAVYAIESSSDLGDQGAEVMLYRGELVELGKDDAAVKLLTRYKLRFRPFAPPGVDSTDWWPTPLKQYCYSEIEFTDWGGPYKKGQVVRLPMERIFHGQNDLVEVSRYEIHQSCPSQR